MTTIIDWSISELERHTADGIVYNVHYRVDASNGVYKAGAYGSVGLEPPAEGDSVIPFSDLTPEVVIEWTKNVLGTESVEQVTAALENNINEQSAPTTTKGVPW